MTWTVEDIVKVCKETAESLDTSFNLPVKINGRLTTTLGRVLYRRDELGDYPTRMEFSKHFLESATDECIYQTILHEFVHWYLLVSTGVSHGHDALFKETCRKIGCTNNMTTTKVEQARADESYSKYTVNCVCCDYKKGWMRKTAVLRNIEKNIHLFSCPECGSEVVYKQNW